MFDVTYEKLKSLEKLMGQNIFILSLVASIAFYDPSILFHFFFNQAR